MAETCLQGEGFRLRRWRADDLQSLVRHANDEQVSRGLSHRFPFPYTHVDGQEFLSGHVIDLAEPVFAIEINGEACGGIGAHVGNGERSQSAELGYWLGQTHWGRGVMTRVVAVFAPWVMHELQLYRLQANVLDSNPASAQVLLKNEFQEEGTQHAAVFKRGVLHDLRLFARVRRSLQHDH